MISGVCFRGKVSLRFWKLPKNKKKKYNYYCHCLGLIETKDGSKPKPWITIIQSLGITHISTTSYGEELNSSPAISRASSH